MYVPATFECLEPVGGAGVFPRVRMLRKTGQLTDYFLPYCWQASYILRFMNSLPNTTVPFVDFNLPNNFNPLALAKLLVCVFPINGDMFFYGNMYPILEKLLEGGVKLLWHRAFNTLDGLTGYTIIEGSGQELIRIAEYWGFNFEHYDDFDPASFSPVHPPALTQGTAVPNQYLAQGLTPPASSSVAGPSSANA